MSMFSENNLEARYEEAYEEVTPNGSDDRAIVSINIDVSGSVSNWKNSISTAAKKCIADLKKDDITRGTAFVQMTFFGVSGDPGVLSIGPKSVAEYTDAEIDQATADCGYGTPGEEALDDSRKKCKTLLKEFVSSDLGFKRPIKILISDLDFNTFNQGGYNTTISDCKEKKINLIIVVTPSYNTEKAKELMNAGAIVCQLEEQNEIGYSKLFNWITGSIRIVSVSVKDNAVELPNPAQYGLKPLCITV